MLSTIDSKITPNDLIFDTYIQGDDHTDITINLQLNGHLLTGIMNGLTPLIENTDYTLDGSTVTIKKEYLNTLNMDQTTVLTFTFNSSTPQNLSIYVSNYTPDDANLTDLQIDGTTVTDFDSDEIGPYDASIPYAQTSVVITPTLSNPYATFQVAGDTDLVVGPNEITVTVTSQKEVSLNTRSS
ncbi:X2-like carbohydrate binding domain-containing protein [Paenibacillus chungangensis]|uniref:X2-like carbohydrate binding domain-containing protein n=1 Tax=Paenibacillus chungangensis TaxID=696535 RepID=A0ABW3HTW8_9BACL